MLSSLLAYSFISYRVFQIDFGLHNLNSVNCDRTREFPCTHFVNKLTTIFLLAAKRRLEERPVRLKIVASSWPVTLMDLSILGCLPWSDSSPEVTNCV